MKARIIFYLICLALIVPVVNANEKGPVVISPGIETGVAIVAQSCPTFSWTAVEWAKGYRVEVFNAVDYAEFSYEELAAISYPVLSKEIHGQALSWTPSSEEGLGNEAEYVWYVQAIDAYGVGMWSEGKSFRVNVAFQFGAIEERLSKSLQEYGVGEDIITDVLKDVKETLVPGLDAQGIGNRLQDKIGIQGTEGATNTFYGTNAGFSISGGGTGINNSFFGVSAGYSNTGGNYNTFLGYQAGYSNSMGHHNTFIGYRTGYANATGAYNTFIGHDTGYITTGSYNTFIGNYAGYWNSTGHHNTFLGRSAGDLNSTGSYNTNLGYQAGYSNSTGSGNVSLGYNAGYNETGSNKLYIDNSDTSAPLIYGEFDNNIIAVNGKLGVGTQFPGFPMHLVTKGTNAAFVIKRSDGAINYINATTGFGNFGTVNNYPLRLVANGLWRMRLDSDNSLTMKSGATCTTGGVWTDASSRELKENIRGLTTDEAQDALEDLNPVRFNYKADQEEERVGFIAEDVPDLVATRGRKGLSPMDVVAVLTKVVQEQQKVNKEQAKAIQEQQKANKEQQKAISDLREEIAELKRK